MLPKAAGAGRRPPKEVATKRVLVDHIDAVHGSCRLRCMPKIDGAGRRGKAVGRSEW
jgi:hypothetical protein